MAHNVTIGADGKAEAYYALKPAWHGLGTVVEEAKTSKDVIRLASLDWEVQRRSLLALGPTGEVGDGVRVSDHYANVRADTNDVLGVVGERYKIVQNSEAFDFIDTFSKSGELRYESAGSLMGGKSVWMLARMMDIDHTEVIPGDAVNPYLLFMNRHDGGGAIKILPTSVRVVCQNTLSLALTAGSKQQLSISHVGSVQAKLAAAREALCLAHSEFRCFMGQSKEMAAFAMDMEQMRAFVAESATSFFSSAGLKPETVTSRVAEIQKLLLHPTQNLSGMVNTLWQAYNAVSHYADHVMPSARSANNGYRMVSILQGASHKLKNSAWELALSKVG